MSSPSAALPLRADIADQSPARESDRSQPSQPHEEQTPSRHDKGCNDKGGLFDEPLDNQKLLRRVVGFYHARLSESPAAREYLVKQGLAHPELAEQFEVGFADREFSRRLPPKQQRFGMAIRGQLKRLGILHASGHAHFNGCLTLPIRDPQDSIVQVYGRRLRSQLPSGTPRDLWLASAPEATLFNMAAIRAGDPWSVVLAESVIDALHFWSAGLRNVTACCGPGGFQLTGAHATLLKETGVRRMLLAQENTQAGNEAAEATARRVQAAGIECVRLVLPPGKGAGQLAANGDARRQLVSLVEAALSQAESTAFPKPPVESSEPSASPSDDDRQAALAFLEDEQLIERVLEDFETCGLVGEEDNKLLAYLTATSRLLDRPLAALIQSSSAAGKTSLLDAVLRFMPPEEQVRLSALTPQALYYMGPHDLRHKILSIAEEQGLQQASYALKLLQSEGRLTLASAEKDPHRGQTATQLHHVQGPVALLVTTTRESVDDELENRCLKLQVDEGPQQTLAIQHGQRQAYTLPGRLQADRRRTVCRRQQEAQRMLRSLPVVIPPELLADEPAFRSDQVWMRREHAKFLSLIAASALLHQFQRTIRQAESSDRDALTCLEAAPVDVQRAWRLIQAPLRRSFDALLPQTRRLLELLADFVRRQSLASQVPPHQVRLTQRQMREAFDWTDHQIRKHLQRLVRLEYVLVHRSGVGNQRHYELVWPATSPA